MIILLVLSKTNVVWLDTLSMDHGDGGSHLKSIFGCCGIAFVIVGYLQIFFEFFKHQCCQLKMVYALDKTF